MKRALILLPYANPHLALFYQYMCEHYVCDFYVHSKAHQHRQHVIIKETEIFSIDYKTARIKLKQAQYDIVFSHGAFYQFVKLLFFCKRVQLIILSEQLIVRDGVHLQTIIKKLILRRLQRKHNLSLFSLGPVSVGEQFSRLAGKPIPTFAYGYFPDWQPRTNTRPHPSIPIRIVFAGQFIERKNIRAIIAAMAISESVQRGDALITFAGNGPLLSLINETALAYYAGSLDRSQLAELLTDSDALILPSHREGWGAVVNEAAACGCALLLTSSVSSGYLCLQDGITGMTITEDPSQIAATIDKLSADRELLAHLKQNAFDHYSHLIKTHDSELAKNIAYATTRNSI
jgi:glycosyltransferase involved in cell wall biosynthesis